MNNIFGENLKYLRKKNDIEQLELAKMLGRKSASSISEWEKGSYTPKMGVLSDIARIFNVPLQDLMSTELSKKGFENYQAAEPSTVKIPVLGEIACGDPILVAENVSEYRLESPDRLPAGELYYVKAKGDSMEPTIPDGSYVLIREQPEVENGEIAAVLLNDDTEVTLKRIKKQDGLVLLVPENSSYEAHIITENSPAKILGRAIRFTQDL